MRVKKQGFALLLAIAMMLACFSGCTTNEPPATSGTEPVETGTVENTSNATERTVVDMVGRSVTIPTEIKKIGVLGSIPVINGFVEVLGAGDRICNNMAPNFSKNDTWKYQYEFAPQLSDCPIFEDGGEILSEVVLETKPDVCLVMEQEKAEQLESLGIPAICLSWKEDEDVKAVINLLGDILDEKEAAEKYCTYFDATVKKANELTANLAENEKKTVLTGSVSSLEYPLLIGEWWIKNAGGISVTDNGRQDDTYYVNYSAEDLLKWNPDVIITNRSSHVPLILADSNFSNITAVKNNELYAAPCVAHIWSNRTVEQPLMVLWTLNKLYPELYSEAELAKEIKSFYSDFFHYDMTDEQVQAIIHTPNE